jgi:hypothetical protein
MSWGGCARCANTTTPLSPECAAPPFHVLRETLACRRVVYTALIGPYDHFEAFADAHAPQRAPGVCYVAVVDALRERNYSYWRPAVLPRLFPGDAARSAHVLKSVPLQLFPHADWVLYMDAKTTLAMPAPTLVGRWLRSNGQKALHVLRHPHGLVGTARDGLVREFAAERSWLLKRRRGNWQTDVGDLDAQRRRYCDTASLCRIGDVVETSLMVWSTAAAGKAAALDLLACHWFYQICFGSQREQLSLPYVVHALDASRHVRYVPHAHYRRYWGWLDHRSCNAKGVCK